MGRISDPRLKEEILKACLACVTKQDFQCVSDKYNITVDCLRDIYCGTRWAAVLPELPRFTKQKREEDRLRYREQIIRALLVDNRPKKEVGLAFGLSAKTLVKVEYGRAWRNVLPEIPRRVSVDGPSGNFTSIYSFDKKEAIVRDALSVPYQPTKIVSGRHGCSRNLIIGIRTGRLWVEILPEIERKSFERQRAINCAHCNITQWVCTLGFPDSFTEDERLNANYCVGCAAFTDKRKGL